MAELDLESVLDNVLQTARELTGARYAAIGVLDDEKEELARFLFVGSTRSSGAASARYRAGTGCSAS